MKKTFLSILVCIICMHAFSQNTAKEPLPEWYNRFLSPSKATSAWTFWYWMYGCVTDEGIVADLKAMQHAGISGFYLMPIKDTSDGKQYNGTARQLSDDWWKRIDKVYSTADSLGLQMGIHFSDGFALGGGPWITPKESMQKVVWADTIITGGRQTLQLKMPHANNDYYEDIALYAYPATFNDNRKPKASVSFPYKSSQPCDIVMSYDMPFTLRSVQIVTGGNNYQAHRFKVYASDNGIDYRFIREISPARQGWQNTDAYATYAIPATTARYFKFHWTPEGSDPGSEDMDAAKWKPNLKIGDIVMGSEPVIDGYEGKSGVVWRVSEAFPVSDKECVPSDKFINLTSQLSPTGEITVNLPKGDWHLLRMGHTSTGHTNATGGGARGLECDKFSRNAINKQLDHWFAAIYKHVPADVARRVLTRLHVDSWECGSQNWSENFAQEFKSRRGYDLMAWLPLYAGIPIASSADSEKVLRDIRQTIAELINDVFFDEVEKGAQRYGVKLSCECVAPTMVSDGLLHYSHADFPMGEFWLNSPTHDKPNDMLDAISGAHIYGKDIIQAEGFTEVRGTWDEHPGMLKPLLDRNYCLGINSIVYHVNTHNPWLDKAPGMTLDGIGTFFQRDNTWWKEMPAFNSYIQRCQALLQYGEPVVDIAVYTGDEFPRRSVLPERLITSLPGLFGQEAINREEKRLANIGQPLEVSPVGVTHTANMTKADTWTNPLRGYQYDSFNRDVLNNSHVEKGRLVTSDGMKYNALVIPLSRKMNPDRIVTCWNIIDSLENRGLNVIREAWTKEDLTPIGISRDAVLPEGIAFTHRRAADADIYFLSNQTNIDKTFPLSFRDKRKYCYLADAVTGNIYSASNNMTLLSGASIFCIFSDIEISDLKEPLNTKLGETKPLDCDKWTVVFDKNNLTVDYDTLSSWSNHDDNRIKYYSGHTVYNSNFKFKGKTDRKVLLDLGDVRDIATIYVNGINCGTIWTSPYQADITHAVKKGKNTIQIEVVNTWANALLGNDNGTPPFEGIWTNGKYRRADKQPIPAGLLGPINIIQM
ncbi:MAG: glycosyl hydrolase [Prevotella sp.]